MKVSETCKLLINDSKSMSSNIATYKQFYLNVVVPKRLMFLKDNIQFRLVPQNTIVRPNIQIIQYIRYISQRKGLFNYFCHF
jgi:hypothetical protein